MNWSYFGTVLVEALSIAAFAILLGLAMRLEAERKRQ